MPSRSTGSCAAPLSFWPTRCHVPVRSICADTGPADSERAATESAHIHRDFFMASPGRRTGGRIPLAAVGFLLEHRRRQSGVGQELRIVDLSRDGEPLFTTRPLVEIPVLGHDRVLA